MWTRNPSVFWGGLLVILGMLFLLSNLGVLENVNFDVIWPVGLIALGVWLIATRVGRVGAPPAPPSEPPAPSEPPTPSDTGPTSA